MREPNMKWFFQPDGDGTRQNDSEPGQLGIPAVVLERHGARVLDPGHAADLADSHGFPKPRSTVYRARTLLVPDDLLQDENFINDINLVLARAGMKLVPPEEDHDIELDADRDDPDDIFRDLRALPRPAVLVPLENHPPVVIDAWVALQTLRAATPPPEPPRQAAPPREPSPGDKAQDADQAASGEKADAPNLPVLDRERVDRIGLEHLLIGSAILASPVGNSPGGITGGQDSTGGGSGPGTNDSYVFSGGDPRTPVAVLLDPPMRKKDRACRSRYGRRPVIAVLDTGVRAHPWLDAGGFVTTDNAIQEAICQEGQRALDKGDKPRQVIKDARDAPITDYPLIGELNDAIGHSTFIAGIVRQVTPDARVLAIRICHSDGVLNEGDIICALRHLAKRIALAREDDLEARVDVVSLSFGYFSEAPQDRMVHSGLWRAIRVLLRLGVVVVACAGNNASSRRFYPAAFAEELFEEEADAGGVPVISVGALNPNGTKAMFSNDGRWVKAWALGAAVVSTYPIDVDASRTPELRIPVNRKREGELPPGREALDPDDYSDGFAVWSGTSFSTPYLAALITGELMEGACGAKSQFGLNLPGRQAAARRAGEALTRLRNKAAAASAAARRQGAAAPAAARRQQQRGAKEQRHQQESRLVAVSSE
jgi:subtilisin family serine protease